MFCAHITAVFGYFTVLRSNVVVCLWHDVQHVQKKYDWKKFQQFGCHLNFQWKEITFYMFSLRIFGLLLVRIFFLVTQNMSTVVSKWLGQFSCICSKNDFQFKDQHKDFPHLLTPDLTFLLFLQHTNVVFLYSFLTPGNLGAKPLK